MTSRKMETLWGKNTKQIKASNFESYLKAGETREMYEALADLLDSANFIMYYVLA